MIRTEADIYQDFLQRVKQSPLADAVSGDVYLFGERCEGSDEEDCVIKVLSDVVGQVQGGEVTINVFVRSTDPFAAGEVSIHSPRARLLARLLQEFVSSLSLDNIPYRTQQKGAVRAYRGKVYGQCFLQAVVEFSLCTEEDGGLAEEYNSRVITI